MSSSVLEKKEEQAEPHSGNGTPKPPPDDDGGNGNGGESSGTEDIKELRKLIVQSQEVGEVLPEAVSNNPQADKLSRATLPIVEENIRQSVARDPKVLAEALFPAIGPAIRRSISQALSSMMQSLNQTLEYSVSPKGIGWRLEALRTGKSFGEIVMLKTLLYRVEQVFLIHKESGILLQHAAANPADTQDADMVSAMLTAIEDFVHDSFKTADGAVLDSLKVRELSVWIEHSPDAVLAAVIRGTPPLDLRETFSEAIEQIQYEHESNLENFDGHVDLFDSTHPILERCLRSQASEAKKSGSFFKPTNFFIAGIAGLLLLVAGYFGWQYWRWTNYLDEVKSEPGIVVAETNFGLLAHSVSGLRDPLSKDPKSIQKEAGFDEEDISHRWRFYNDADPIFIVGRAEKLLNPPKEITLSFADGILTADGTADVAWFANAAQLTPNLEGVTDFRASDELVEVIKSRIESRAVLFECNTADYTENQNRVLQAAARDIERLLLYRSDATVEIRGQVTSAGTMGLNKKLAEMRAERVRRDISLASKIIADAFRKEPGVLKSIGLSNRSGNAGCRASFDVRIGKAK